MYGNNKFVAKIFLTSDQNNVELKWSIMAFVDFDLISFTSQCLVCQQMTGNRLPMWVHNLVICNIGAPNNATLGECSDILNEKKGAPYFAICYVYSINLYSRGYPYRFNSLTTRPNIE